MCPGKTLELRDATEEDLARCYLGVKASRNPADYLCENIKKGALVNRIAVAELTEIRSESADRIAELEGMLERAIETANNANDTALAAIKQRAELERKNAELEAALQKVIDMNRQHAFDQYGDADKAESWACVRVVREAIAFNHAHAPAAAEQKGGE